MQRPKPNQNIQVYVRVRPTNSREKCIRSMEVVEVNLPREIVVKQMFDSKATKKFTFDRTFGPDSKQCDVYMSVVSPLIDEVLAGYNCTVFAYGQTGTGKTYTMIGEEQPELKSSWEDENMTGIVPRALNHLFDELRLLGHEFSMRISYLELYNEELCDLLSTDDVVKIRIFDDSNKKGSVIIQGLEEIPVHSKDDVYKLLAKGQERRKTASTLMNAQSSRSHTVFSILVHIKENGNDGEEMLKIGKLNLVDLAGSENITKAGNEKGIRTRETVNINQSLLTLGRVITALVEKTPHVPYRESKLTRLLQESLGGRTKTSIIATISPGHKDLEETLSTLEYAHRAKNIQNKPELNQRLTKKTVLKEYTEEIDRLKRDLMASRDKNGIYLAEDTYNDMLYKCDSQNKELNDKAQFIKALKDELASKQKIFNEVSLNLIDCTEELKKKDEVLVKTIADLGYTKKVLNTTKQRYSEKKHILEHHVETEKTLLNQAKELMSVAEKASTDVYGLQDAVDRRKTVDNQINTACNQFSTKLNNFFTDIYSNTKTLNSKYCESSELIIDEITSSTNKNNNFAEKSIADMKKIMDLNKTSVLDISDFVNSYKLTTITDANNFVSIIKLLLNITLEKQEVYENNMATKLNLLLNSFNIQNKNHENFCNELLQQNDETKENLRTYVNNHSTKLINFKNELCNDYKIQLEQLNKNIEINNHASEERLKTINLIEEVLKNMKTDYTTMKQCNSELISLSNSITLTQTKTEMNLKQEALGHVEYGEEFNNCKELENIVDEMKINNKKIFDENGENVNDVKELNSIHIKFTNDQLMNIINTTDEYLSSNVNSVTASTSEIIYKNELHQENLSKNVDHTISEIVKENNRINRCKIQCIALEESVQQWIERNNNDLRKQLNNYKDEFDRMFENDMRPYSATGDTPVRKHFHVRNDLAETSPHDRIVQRFRFENKFSNFDLSQSICEGNELDEFNSDLSNMQILINSTASENETLETIVVDDDNSIKEKLNVLSQYHENEIKYTPTDRKRNIEFIEVLENLTVENKENF